MKRATFRVLFYIKRTKKLKDGTAPLYVRLTVNGLRVEFALQKSIDENQWNTEKGCINGNKSDARKFNSSLDLLKNKLYGYKLELEQEGKEVTALSLKNAYLGIDNNSKTILGVFNEHNIRCKGLIGIDIASGTYDRYQACYRHIERFISHQYSTTDMPISSINPIFIRDLEYYLKTERSCCNNTTVKYIKNFKKIVRIAMANGWLKSDPFANIKFHLDDVDMDFLSEEELDTVMKKQFKIERIQQVKDVYLFCCFTGLAFVDVKNLSYSEIEDINGKLWIKKRRQKTKNWCNIPILEPALKLMDKYKSHPVCVKNNTVLPVLSNQKMNAYLKEIADLCGIDKKLSTHTARHTFATTVTLSNHVSIEVVSKMLGHSSINMTKKYARVVDDLISKDMMKIQDKYKSA
jgi:site-specific recombinase XerD